MIFVSILFGLMIFGLGYFLLTDIQKLRKFNQEMRNSTLPRNLVPEWQRETKREGRAKDPMRRTLIGIGKVG